MENDYPANHLGIPRLHNHNYNPQYMKGSIIHELIINQQSCHEHCSNRYET